MKILIERDMLNLFAVDKAMSIYEKYLSFYNALENCVHDQLGGIVGISPSDILYSKYYWFLKLKRQNELLNGLDAGYDQQAFELLVSIYEHSGVVFDPNIFAESIKAIETLAYSE